MNVITAHPVVLTLSVIGGAGDTDLLRGLTPEAPLSLVGGEGTKGAPLGEAVEGGWEELLSAPGEEEER